MGDFVVRQRLVDMIDLDRPLTVVRAPSGAGKTVAVLQWAHQVQDAGVPVRWFDGQRSTVDDVMRELAELGADTDQRAVVVLDHVESWQSWPAREIVRELRFHRQLTMVVCSRTHLPWFAAAALELEVGGIYVSDLRLTLDELVEMASKVGLDLTYAAAQAIHTSIAGYAALARVGLVTSNASGTTTWWSAGRVRRFLAGHLRSEIVDPVALADVRRAAYIEHLSADSLGAVSSDGSATTMLASLESIGAVDQWVDGQESVFYLPTLVRDTLKHDLTDVPVGDVDDLHDAVVARFLDLDLPHLALAQAVAGHRQESVGHILDRHAWVLLKGHEAVLRAALRELPDEVRTSSTIARALDDTLALRPPRDRDQHTGQWRSLPDDPARRLNLETIGVVASRRAGLVADDVTISEQAVAAAEEALGSAAPEHVPAAQLVLEIGITAFAANDIATAEARLRRVARASVGAETVTVRHEAMSFLALVSAVRGDLQAAARWRDAAVEVRTGLARFGFNTVAIDLADTLMSFESRPVAGGRTVTNEFGEASEVIRLWATYAETRSALLGGGRTRVLHRLRASRLVETTKLPDTADMLSVFEADLLLSLGRGTEATGLLDGVSPTSLFGAVTRARLAYLTGQHDRTVHVLASLTAGSHPYDRLRIEAQLLAALSYERIGAVDVSCDLLKRVVESAEHLGLVTPFATVPVDFLRRHSRSLRGLADVIARLEDLGVRHPYPDSISLVRLTPRETEVLAALARGHTIDEIALQLFVSRNTVKTQARGLYRKLEVSNRSEAVAAGHRLGLLRD